ncbi:MAG: RICIN domain-containing protein [Oscillospiraceae bacterium]|nr:RICIN domain-containing protein [Oscillospiraceae bacterium]
MKTGKRVLAIILTLVLCIGMLPTTVSAASYKSSSSSGVYYYTLKNVGTGKYLNVKGNSSANNANITLWQKDGTSGQNFALYYDSANKGYVIVPECSTSRAVNIYGSSAGAGKNICTWTKTGHSTQAWILKAVSGGYIIQSANNKNYVLTASGSSNGSNICIQKYSSTNKKQVWSLSLSKSVTDTVSISSSAASTISKGSSYSMSGTVTSTLSNVKTVTAYVYNSSGKELCSSTKSNISSKSFNLSNLSALSTGSLSTGTYKLKIVATNANGKSATKTYSFKITNSSSSKTLSINWTYINGTGRQTESGPCLCYALAYCRDILDGKTHMWTEYRENSNSVAGLASKASYTKKYTKNSSDVYKAIYEQIEAGKPVVIRVGYLKGRSTGTHFVTVVGYTNVTDTSQLSASNFIILDPLTGTKTENMGTVGYPLGKDDNGYYNYYIAT